MSLAATSRARAPASLISSLSRLEFSGAASTTHHAHPSSSFHPQHAPLIQQRHASTPRRHRKMLNLPPAPVLPEHRAAYTPTGGSGRSWRPTNTPRGDTVVYNPPSAAPNVFHTPAIFLAKDDPRRALYARQQQLRSQEAGAAAKTPEEIEASLPPAVHRPPEKRYNVGPKEIEEMRALRTADDATWTTGTLAKKFDCSRWFVNQVVRSSWERRVQLREEEMRRRAVLWGPRRTKARQDRVKRKALWKYD